jgi:hypothetical protein
MRDATVLPLLMSIIKIDYTVMLKRLTTILFTALFTQGSNAQMEKIDTDRPDQTESAFIVPKKWIQAEIGFLNQSDRYWTTDRKEFYYEYPTLLLKYGVSKCFELRLINTYSGDKYWASSTSDPVSRYYYKHGFSTFQLGGKLNFLQEKGLRPKTSLIAHYDFAGLRTTDYDTIDGINFRFTMQHTISHTISLSYNLGMRWDRFGDPPAYVYTIAPGFNIGERWYAYLEFFGTATKKYQPENSIDAGIAFYVSDNVKLDASIGHGISKNAPNNYLGIGMSFRFKTGK